MKYPKVHSEFDTLATLRKGYSIARLGDGEFKMIDGKGYVREPPNPELSDELRSVLTNPHPRCIVGIPTMNPNGPKVENWQRHEERFLRMLSPAVEYYSAFISRPDSAPWIRTQRFAKLYQSLWLDKRVVVICERKGSAFRAVRIGSRSAVHVECPTEQAYAVIDALEAAALQPRPDIVILSCGPTATCLANRLAARGVQAIDFGSGGSFIVRLLE